MLSAQEAFKCGFLARCVEDQLTPEQMLVRVKQASDILEKSGFGGLLSSLAGKVWDAGKGTAQAALTYGLPAALAAPPILGGLAGYGLARGTDISDTDVSELKDREVIDEYKRQTERLERQKRVRSTQKATRASGRMYM